MRRPLVKKCGPLVKISHAGIYSMGLGWICNHYTASPADPQRCKNIDIFGATKKWTTRNCLIISLGATKMHAGAIKMVQFWFKTAKNVDNCLTISLGATKKSLTRATRHARANAEPTY